MLLLILQLKITDMIEVAVSVKANLNLHNYEDAVADFKVVLELDPQNKAAKNQMAIASHKIKEIRDKEKKTYAGMFDRFASADAKVCDNLQN